MATIKMTSAINTILYPAIKKVMDSKASAFKALVGNFIKKNSQQLYDIVPCDRIYFLDEEISGLKKIVGQDVFNIATKAIKNTYYADINPFNPRAAKDEITLILLMIVKYFASKNDKQMLELACIYLSFSGKFYISVHVGCFPYLPNRNVMEYCINNLMSQKFDLVRCGSVMGAIKSINNTWITTYSDELKNGDDEDIKDIIQQLRDRIKSFLQNITEVYMKAYENKDNFLTYDTDNLGEDNFRTTDNNSAIMGRLTEASINYITSNGVNYRMVKLSADANVKYDELKMIIETINGNNANLPLVKELIGLIIVNYNSQTGSMDFKTIEFVSKAVAPKPNAKDKNIVREKDIIEQLLLSCAERYVKRKSRLATKNSYFRSLLSYYVLIINNVAGKL